MITIKLKIIKHILYIKCDLISTSQLYNKIIIIKKYVKIIVYYQ